MTPMKYALATPLMNVDNKTPINDAQGVGVTFKSICTLVLVQAPDKEADEKYKCFALAVKVESASEYVDMNTEEVARVKRLVGEMMGPVVMGRMFDLLDQREPIPV